MGKRLAILAALAAYVIAEIYLLSVLVGLISISGVIFLLLVEFVLGAWIIKRAGVAALRSLNDSLVVGGSTAGAQAADKGLVALAGLLIAVPGVLTDVFGLALLIPPVRRWSGRVIKRAVTRRAEKYVGPVSPAGYSRGDEAIVVTSVIRDEDVRPQGPIAELPRPQDDR
jgi:UPF0716 protein FxsA